MMYIRSLAFATLILLVPLFGFTTTATALEVDCLAQNDQLVNPNLPNEQLESHLERWLSLSQECIAVPHILHNLGVINAKLEMWDAAAEYFKASLDNEPRAKQSYEHLSSIYRYQAVKAYRNALQSNNPAPKKPAFSYQKSNLQNTIEHRPAPSSTELTVQPSTFQALVNDWLAENRHNIIEANPEYLLITDTPKSFAVIHTSQHSYVLEFLKSQGQWQISREYMIP